MEKGDGGDTGGGRERAGEVRRGRDSPLPSFCSSFSSPSRGWGALSHRMAERGKGKGKGTAAQAAADTRKRPAAAEGARKRPAKQPEEPATPTAAAEPEESDEADAGKQEEPEATPDTPPPKRRRLSTKQSEATSAPVDDSWSPICGPGDDMFDEAASSEEMENKDSDALPRGPA
eukprot:9493725-Pyramimonas_sp.AAC.2